MATTQKGIYYPDNYEAVADIPTDFKKMAESLENADFLQTLYRFKGTVNTIEDLKLKINVNLSDTYKCLEDSNNYTWNGTDWINIGQNIDYDALLNKIEEVNTKIDNLKFKDIFNLVYPIGSIYISTNNTNPSLFFGGTWEQLKDRFLLGAGEIYEAGSTGGEASHTLTVSEMPKHNHPIKVWYDTNGGDYPGIPRTMATGFKIYELKNDANVGAQLTGDSQAHNNMPPYLTVYMWKRVN